MSKTEMGAGDVPVTIDGREYVLKPTLKAAQELSRNNGIATAVQRCASLELDAVVQVVAAGLGRSTKDLAQKIYDTGIRHVAPACITFLTNLSNGGRPLKEEELEELKKGPTEEGGEEGDGSH